MIRINLVRGKRKKRRELGVGSAWIALPVVVLLGTIYFHTTVSGKISRLDADIVKANADIARAAKEDRRSGEVQRPESGAPEKGGIISNLQKGANRPRPVLRGAVAAIPEKRWIDALGVKDEKVTLSGLALNDYTIANFMTALGKTGRFRDVGWGPPIRHRGAA